MATITTTYKTNASGTGQILAKGGGRQRTITYDPAKGVDYNHAAAAGTLMRVFFGQVDEPALSDLLANVRQTVENGRQTFSGFTF